MAYNSVKRRYLAIVFLNIVLDDVTLVPTIKKPLDVFAEGLSSSLVGNTGFEPATSWPPAKRASQAALIPEWL